MEHIAYRPAARIVLGTGLLLMIPLIAMQFATGVNWTGSDFVVAGAMLIGAGTLFHFLSRKAGDRVHRAAAAVAVGTGLFLVWADLAVGIVSDGANIPNLLYLGVAAIEIIGALLARFQPAGMTRALFVTAIAQAAVGLYALTTGLDDVLHIVGINVMFIVLFVSAGALFQSVANRSR